MRSENGMATLHAHRWLRHDCTRANSINAEHFKSAGHGDPLAYHLLHETTCRPMPRFKPVSQKVLAFLIWCQ
jgi:hypothetical protein